MSRSILEVSLKTLLSAAVVTALAACNREPPAQAADAPPPAAAATTADQPIQAAPYQRPTADQLYALVAPIALFPDNLVAQTLAASTHPDDVDNARQFLEGHRDLNGAALIDAADQQPWDPSVKSLVAFPSVLDQMANNGEWTDALGAAYANEPTDVMNAIQVMRSRAQAKGTLKSTSQQKVEVVDRGAPVSQTTVVEQDEIVGPPAQTIEIQPSDPGVVYVPEYDPDVVYGEPVYSRVYETRYVEPAPAPAYRDAVITGVVAFGAGIVVGELFAHHEHHDRPWGWDSWHTSWGGHHDGGRPAVVYDNHPYVVNRTVVNNRYVDRSVHIDNRHNFNNNNIHQTNINQPATPPGAPPQQRPMQRPAQPDYTHMQRPSFAPNATHPTAPNARPALPPPQQHGAPTVAGGQHPFPGAPQTPGQARPGQPQQPGNGFDRGHDHGFAHAQLQAPQQQAGSPHPQPVAPHPQSAAAPAPAAHAAPDVAHATPQPHGNPHVPQFNRPQPEQHQAAPQPRPEPQVTHVPQMPHNEPQRMEQPRHDMPRPMQQTQQHFQPPQRDVAQHMQAPRPEPQQHHEQPHQAPPPQHHDDHKKHDG